MYRSSFVVAALALGGCGAVDDLLPEGPVELSAETRLPEDADGFESATVEEDAVVFHFAGGAEPSFAPGQVIVGASGGGYLRRVERVESDGGALTVHTSAAGLTDVIERGELSVAVSDEGASVDLACPPGAVCRAFEVIDLSGEALFDGEVEGVPVLVEVTRGSLTFDPTVTLDVAIDGGQVQRLAVTADGVLDAELDLRVQAGGPFQLAQEIDLSGPGVPLHAQPFTVLVPTPIGPLPVTGVLELDLFAGFDATLDAEGELEGGLEAQASLQVGARYEGGSWQTSGQPEVNATPHEPTLSGEASAELTGTLRPELRLYLYGVLGPVVSLEPSLRITGEAAPPAAPIIEMEGCLSAALDFQLAVLSLELPGHQDALERCQALYPQ